MKAHLLGVLVVGGVALRPAVGEVQEFSLQQPGARNLGIWRLTHDPAVRDEGNYHNIQCWSPDGRYTCYTHWPGRSKGKAEVHVVDLSTGADRLVDKGIAPRWANRRNWLFYCHFTADGSPSYETGSQVIRYDADSGEKIVIAHGMEQPGGLDSTDTWLFGTQRFRGRTPEHVAVRVRNAPGSKLEPLAGAPNRHAYIQVNPQHPVLKARARAPGTGLYDMNRAWFDFDGSNLRQATVRCEEGHMCWSGNGAHLLIGNRQACGRPWDKPFPSDLVTLSFGSVGDICPCDKAGRYLCGGNLNVVDTRSGDAWPVVFPYSSIIYPMEGDHSELMDIDPKGSPDGTKIHYHSTRELLGTVCATVTGDDVKQPDVIRVESTAGFAESGELVCGPEVIGYRRRTATSFEGLTRRMYGTLPAPEMVRKVRVIFPLSAFLLDAADRRRATPDGDMLQAGVAKDSPLLYQRQTDCYVVVVRRPFAPHLRLGRAGAELIPGEHHWETRGYRLLCEGKPIAEKLLAPGDSFRLGAPGRYTATAVEWSGLESPASRPLVVEKPTSGQVLAERPADFQWTQTVWELPGRTLRVEHLQDGPIAREEWLSGQRRSRIDLNAEGRPIRRDEFQDGVLRKRVYRSPEGHLASEEFFGPDGFKLEYIRYYHDRPERRAQEADHWWYDHGRPTKRLQMGKLVFDTTGR